MIFAGDDQTILKGEVQNTTHNRMELTAVIEALTHIAKTVGEEQAIIIYTDSQYVCGIPRRGAKLQANNFMSKQGKVLQNTDLLKRLIALLDALPVELVKVKAHQKPTSEANYNRDVDKLSRQIVRGELK